MPRKSALTIAEEKIESLKNELDYTKNRIKYYEQQVEKDRIEKALMKAKMFLETYNTLDTAAFLIGEKEGGGLIFQYAGNSLMIMYAFYALIKSNFGVEEATIEKISSGMKEADIENPAEIKKDNVSREGVNDYRWLDIYSAMHNWNHGVNEKPGTYLIPPMLDFICDMQDFYECKYYYLVCVADNTKYPDWKSFDAKDCRTREKDIYPTLDIYSFSGCQYIEEAQAENGITDEARIKAISRAMAYFAKDAYLPTTMDDETKTFYYNQAEIVGVKGIETILKWLVNNGSSMTQCFANVHKKICRYFDLYSKKYQKEDKYGYIRVPYITMYPGIGWSYETKHMIETFWPGFHPEEEY